MLSYPKDTPVLAPRLRAIPCPLRKPSAAPAPPEPTATTAGCKRESETSGGLPNGSTADDHVRGNVLDIRSVLSHSTLRPPRIDRNSWPADERPIPVPGSRANASPGAPAVPSGARNGPELLILPTVSPNPLRLSGPEILCIPLFGGVPTIACGYVTTPEYKGVPLDTFTVPPVPPDRYHFCGNPGIRCPFRFTRSTVYPVKLGTISSLNR